MKKRKKAFISYRNTIKDNTFENYNFLRNSISSMESQWPGYKFITIQPEALPHGTLFSPYDIAEFIYKTFVNYIDYCDKFIILNKDYFDEKGQVTSIWTEAEVCIWSYYSRSKWFPMGKNKDNFYTVITPDGDDFSVSDAPLLELTKAQRAQLRQCALDFDRQPMRPDYSAPYFRTAKHLIVTCNNCGVNYMLDRKTIKKNSTYLSECSHCRNGFHILMDANYVVCHQTNSCSRDKKVSIFDMLYLLFEKKPIYPLLELKLCDDYSK